jgi:H/ACA ribonucleoprotein complex non-core subunit NAF1
MSQNVQSEISKIDQFLKQLAGGSSTSSDKETAAQSSNPDLGTPPVQPLKGNSHVPQPSMGVPLTANTLGIPPIQRGIPQSQPLGSLVNYSSSSDSSSTSSDDSASTEDLLSEDSEDDGIAVHRVKGGLEQERRPQQGPRVKGELGPGDLPDIEALSLEVPEGSEVKECGHVTSVVDDLIVVQGMQGSEALDADTVLWNDNKQPIGKIFEVFGPVKLPFYSIRKSKDSSLDSLGISVGSRIFFIPRDDSMTKYVFAGKTPLQPQKGSDASWKDDVEPPEECLDYSDDETERAARRKLQAKRKAGSGDKVQEDSNSTTQEGSSSATQEGSGENQPTESGVQLVKVMDHSKKPHHHHHHHSHKKHHHHGPPMPVQSPPTGPHPTGYHGQPPPSMYSTNPRMQIYFQAPPVDLLTGPLSPERTQSPMYNPNSTLSSTTGISSPPAHSNNPLLHQHYFPSGGGPQYHPPPLMPGAGLIIRTPQSNVPQSHVGSLPPPLLPAQQTTSMYPSGMLPQQPMAQTTPPPLIRPNLPLRPPIAPTSQLTNQKPTRSPRQQEFEETDL